MDAEHLHATAQNSPIRPGDSDLPLIYGAMLLLILILLFASRVTQNRRTPHDDDLDIDL